MTLTDERFDQLIDISKEVFRTSSLNDATIEQIDEKQIGSFFDLRMSSLVRIIIISRFFLLSCSDHMVSNGYRKEWTNQIRANLSIW